LRPFGPAGEPPFRAELFNVEQLVRHARLLAGEHRIAAKAQSSPLLARLDENESRLRAFNRSTAAVHQSRSITPASEWLLDNFYLIEEQIQMAKRHLPKGYSRELPRLTNGPSAGFPRVYDIVLELIAHVDAQIDLVSLQAFVAAYQTVHSLKLGELWAIPIMLRLGLIENLKRIITRLVVGRQDRDLADLWIDRLQATAESNPSLLVIVMADMAKAELPLSSSFVAEFCQRLSRQSPELYVARTWLEQRLVEHGLSIEQLVHMESQSQAADQVSVSHSISSLRFLSATDWKVFVEALSLVERTLRLDQSGTYPNMDFATRDRYRHAVEFFARQSGHTEDEVARRAIQLAERSAQELGRDHRKAHVGFYLLEKGQSALGQAVNVRWPWSSTIERGIHRFPLTFYVGGIAVLTGVATAGILARARFLGLHGWPIAFYMPVFLLCASQLAVTLVNCLSTLLVKPRLLPRLDCTSGIPDGCQTMVVIPTMLTSLEDVDHLIEKLEIHHLANPDPRLHFALLTDWRDAKEEILPGDHEMVQRARAGVELLNQKYRLGVLDRFFLLHRPRRWNPSEGSWMGYERKRGKLMEFNGLLRGGYRERFSEVVGDTAIFASIKYVITLDTDTQLPRDAARQLVGTMAHPLIRPVFDASRRVVVDGYGILQPRVGVSLPSSRRSWFVRLFAGETGIDPYTKAVSDVYQDIFREGSFIGKGIYDVDAFQEAMNGRVPDNAVLSHDLLEACYVRSALVSDVELYEEYPSRYNVDINRRHRWIRGDWQISQWLLPRVPGSDLQGMANPLSLLSQWKIFDNLRRSLVPVALTALMLTIWLANPGLGRLGTVLTLAVIALPALLSVLVELYRSPADFPLAMHLWGVCLHAGRQLCQILLTLAFLPYDAFISLDAVGRTLLRLIVTHRRLLEWQTSSDSERTIGSSLGDFIRNMWIGPAIVLAAGYLLVSRHSLQSAIALPVLCLWAASPWVAWRISLPIVVAAPDLNAAQLEFLRRMARKTWRYFETFVTAGENWLPPDNFQEIPKPIVASRTSPTNIGLSLLANLGAYDLGYLSAGGLIKRTRDTLATMQRLERYRGHFYNWYDTRTLQALPPLYISSVDSGNLAGHLLTLASGLREVAEQAKITPQLLTGLRDTLSVLENLIPGNPALQEFLGKLQEEPPNGRAALVLLQSCTAQAVAISNSLSSGGPEVKGWAQTLKQTCEDHAQDMLYLAPWMALPEPNFLGRLPDPVPMPAGAPGRVDPPATGPEALKKGLARLEQTLTLREVASLDEKLSPLIEIASRDLGAGPAQLRQEDGVFLAELLRSVREGSNRARQRLLELEDLSRQADELAAMDFVFLFDPSRDLFSTGFNVTERKCDATFYDLLASEARLGGYVAIAQGQVPQEHWFSMGRLIVGSGGKATLVSWSGSMFEYLMPLLVMPSYENTLLDRTCKAAVERQIEYGKSLGVPWGVSESGYNRTDTNLNYQYRAFGVPGLGLKRGLADDLVIAPYASALALMVSPVEACHNLQRLEAMGIGGAYGFYEAVDLTPRRMPPGETSAIIRSFMAHHQGMSLLSLVNLLRDNSMQRRFLACPLLKAADLLLQERMPRTPANIFTGDLALETSRTLVSEGESVMRIMTNPSSSTPEVHLLSNGSYHVAITSAGGGYSRWRNLGVTRWREDPTRDCWGTFIYLRDLENGDFWSTAFQPTTHALKNYEAIFTQARAEFRQIRAGLEIHTEISVSSEDDVELRRVSITNRSPTRRTIELTSYAEIALAKPGTDAAHPAFSNLFVQTEFVPKASALLCTRRSSSPDENPPWMLHLMAGLGGDSSGISCETDRSRFTGRGGTLADPAAMHGDSPLSNTVGSVLDPIVSLRRTFSLAPHETAVIALVFGATESREAALAYADKYQGLRMVDRAFELAWTHSQVTLRHLSATEREAQVYGRLAGALIYADPARRAVPGILRNNRRGQSGLWSYGISGDLPIVLLRVSDAAKIEIVRQMIRAHSYWRMKGLAVELVILNEEVSVYRQSLQDQITQLIASGIEAQMLDKPGGIFVRLIENVPNDDRVLLQSVARIVLNDEYGTLEQQLERKGTLDPLVPLLTPSRYSQFDPAGPLAPRELIFQNGIGGFTRDGHEYVITLEAGKSSPAPWVNVLANPFFGTVISESGSAYTWGENSHEFRLTPWSNDPVRDTSGEALYIRDEQTGQFWSPTPSPARGATPYVIRHGFGYTVFEHTEYGIISELWVYVAMDAPVKFSVLKLRNISGRPRRISVTGYWEWVLGELRQNSLMHVQTEVDLKTGALVARNFYNTEFADRIAFIDVSDVARTITGDRKEFLGRNGNVSQPAALRRARLSGKVGAGLDPCGAVQVAFDLPDGQERETCFRIGVGRSPADMQELVLRFRRADSNRTALEGVWAHWNRTLGSVNVDTPDPSVNVMANGWLLYQTLSCRLWARTGFYQSSGAYGFRDQLQDVMALVHSEPAITRGHLLRAAARQFQEGDVQHWWHPPSGRGVRTECSDDFLWLPYATCRYVTCVADSGVLDEKINFIEGRQLKPEE
jgi:cyclic beta-1,2-glucan synthetase